MNEQRLFTTALVNPGCIWRMMMDVTPVREFWQKKVNKTVQMFEYGAFSQDKFLDEMSRLGFDRTYIQEVLDNEVTN